MDENPKNIYFTNELDSDVVNSDFTRDATTMPGIVYGDKLNDDEFADSGTAVVYCFIGIFIVALIVLSYVFF